MNFEQTPEFARDVKQLQKSWRSIPTDIANVKLVIERLYIPIDGIDLQELRNQFFAPRRAAIITKTDKYEVVKIRLDCASLGNDKKTRLIFIAIREANTVRLVQLYAKNSNEREDARRLKRYLP